MITAILNYTILKCQIYAYKSDKRGMIPLCTIQNAIYLVHLSLLNSYSVLYWIVMFSSVCFSVLCLPGHALLCRKYIFKFYILALEGWGTITNHKGQLKYIRYGTHEGPWKVPMVKCNNHSFPLEDISLFSVILELWCVSSVGVTDPEPQWCFYFLFTHEFKKNYIWMKMTEANKVAILFFWSWRSKL